MSVPEDTPRDPFDVLQRRHGLAEMGECGGGVHIERLSVCLDASATLDDLREAVTTFEDTARIARRVFGGAHPITVRNERSLRNARTVLRARETPSGSS